jgi:Domain of unknown function (DUF4410)
MRTLRLALILGPVGGCAAVPAVEQTRPINGDLARYDAVQVAVDGSDQIRQTSGFEPTRDALLEEFVADVKASRKYSAVGTEVPGGSVLMVNLTITDLNYVHGATRGLTGIMAGRAVLSVTMSLRDKQTGSMLGEIRAGHSSSHAQGVFSPVTSRQVTAIAKELSAKIIEK